MQGRNYFIDKRKYAVRFIFENKFDAKSFSKLPIEFKGSFELNDNLDMDGNQYVRIAQIILKKHVRK